MHEESYFPERKNAAERLQKLVSEKLRVEQILTTYMQEKRAIALARKLIDWALELDRIAACLTGNPAIQKTYAYDGIFFTYLDPERFGFSVSYDGLHFLCMLNERNVACFLHDGVFDSYGMLQWLRKNYRDIARLRMQNLETNGTIGLVDPETLRKIARQAQQENCEEPSGQSGIPPRDDPFWDYYEDQLRK